jgi:hypothetical protein
MRVGYSAEAWACAGAEMGSKEDSTATRITNRRIRPPTTITMIIEYREAESNQ